MGLFTFLFLLMLIMCMPSLFHLRKHPSPDSNTYLNLLILGRAGLWIFSLDSQSSDTITKTYSWDCYTWIISCSEREGMGDILKSIVETPPGKFSTVFREEEFKLEQTHKRVTGRTGEWWILSNNSRLEKFSLFSLAKWRLRGDLAVYASFQAS